MKDYRVTTEILESRDFYDTLRNEVAPCMTLVAVCDEGKVYFWDDYVTIMLLVGEGFVALTYAGGMAASDWLQMVRDCNEAMDDPLMMKRLSRSFCYLASIDRMTGEFRLHDYGGSDWLGIYPRAKRGVLRRLYYRRPYWWPESYQSTIDTLNYGRGEDDSLASNYDDLVGRLSSIIFTISFSDTAATFDSQYGRTLPLEGNKLSLYELPIVTHNLRAMKPRENFRCTVDVGNANHYLDVCNLAIDNDSQLTLPRGNRIEVPSYGLAGLAFLAAKLPGMTEDGQAFFVRSLQFLPECEFNYERLIAELSYQQVGAGIIILKLLLEGMLGLGGDLFPSKSLQSALRNDYSYYCGVMSTALKVQKRVISKLTSSESGNWIKEEGN